MITTILATIFVLGILIFVHELGHFLVAKAVGIGVPRFSIGLGPKIFGIQKGETEYRLAWIPFGGYVKMAGDRTAEAMEGDDEGVEFPPEKQFDEKPVWARLLVVSAGSAVNFIWAIFVFTWVFHTSGLQSIPTTTVGDVSWPGGHPPRELAQLEPGSEITSVGGTRVTTWDDVLGGVLDAEGALTMTWVDADGNNRSVSVPASDSIRSVIAGSIQPLIAPEVGRVNPGGPADRAGIEEGDRFVVITKGSVRHEISRWMDAVNLIHTSPEEEIELTMERGDSLYTVRVTPAREKIPDSQTTMKEVGLIGIMQPTVQQRLPLIHSFTEAASRSVYLGGYILELIPKFFTGEVSFRQVGGPILVGQMAGESAKQGLGTLLSFMALFSVNLAVLNMLPIPVLDGGHVVFLFIEFIRRRPLTIEQRAKLSQVGFILLILLMVFVTFNDSLRILGF